MSAHHPSNEMIEKFARGHLDGSLASVVSAHIEFCSSCKKSVKKSEDVISNESFSQVAPVSAPDAAQAWKHLQSRIETSPKSAPFESRKSGIEINGHHFDLPRSIQKLAEKPLQWMSFGGSGRICKLGNEAGKSLFLIYVGAGEEVPPHSHAGMEYSYVVAGRYSEGGLCFDTGDFSFSDESLTHAPKAESDDGCLILSSVENRLNFIQGWLRPLNGILWWVLNLRLKLSRSF